MSSITPNPNKRPEPELPPEWQEELAALHEDSYEREQFLKTLGELGITGVASAQQEAESLGEPPEGFVSWRRVPETAIRTDQFGGHLHALDTSKEYLSPETIEYETDQGNKIRVSDLRPHLTASMRKVGPQTERDKRYLDEHFLRDVKSHADRSQGRHNVVKGHPLTVHYSRGGDTKERAYWVIATDDKNTDKVPTVARIGDIGNSPRDEEKFYNRQLGLSFKPS